MRRNILKYVALLAGALVLVLLVLVVRGKWILGQSYAEIAHPAVRADRSEATVRRGEMLFQSLCIECHGGADGRATGKQLAEVPAFLGTFYSANLAHPEHGVLMALATRPPSSEPPTPTAPVAIQPISCCPGMSARATKPITRPNKRNRTIPIGKLPPDRGAARVVPRVSDS